MQNEKKRKLHLVYILLALVVACGMWFYVDEHSNNGGPRVHQTEITDIPIEYVNADKLAGRGLMMLKEQTTRTADITFEGIRRQVARLERDKVRLTVDLSDVTMPGIQFITYAVPWILGEMKKTLRKNSDAQFTVSMQEELGEDGVTLEETLSGSDNIDFSGLELRIALSQLDSEEQRLICLRYFRDKTQKETADLLKRSQAQISRMEHKALDKLHNIMIE